MTTAERAAVAALVAANHKLHDRICTWIPGMNSCDPQIKETMREFHTALCAVEQLPGFSVTEEEPEVRPEPTQPIGKTRAELDAAYLEYHRKGCEDYKAITGRDWPHKPVI